MKLLLRNPLLKSFFLLLSSSALPSATSAPANNPFDRELGQLRSAFSSADRPQKLVLLSRFFLLRNYIDDPAAVSSIFAEFAQENDPLIRAESRACLDEIALLEGAPINSGQKHWYQNQEQQQEVLAEAAQGAPEAESLETQAELEHLAGRPEAAGHMQQAAQLAPTAARWERAAALTDDPLRKFSALQAGLALDGRNVPIHIDLAIYYIGRQQLEKAHSIFQEALRLDPDNYVVAERLAGLYLNLGLRSAALEQLKLLENRSSLPIWLRSRLATDYEQLGLLDDAARLAKTVIQKRSTDREQLQLLARFHERRHMIRELALDYLALLRLQPDSATLWFQLGQSQLEDGDLSEAKASMLRAVALDPRNGEAHRQLGRIYRRLHSQEAANRELAASELLGKDSYAPTDSGLLVNAQNLAAEAFRQPPPEDDIALADIRVQKLDGKGLSRMHVQQVFYVGSDAAASSHRLANIRYSPGSEALEVIHARVWKRNGAIIEAEEEGENPVADNTVAMYYDMRSRQLRFPGLEKGDVTELEYSLSPTLAASPYPGYFGELITLACGTPARLERYALISPSDQHIFVHAEKLPPPATTEQNRIRTLVWEAHDVSPLSREPRSPGITETAPYVHLSTVADWKELGLWYAELIRPQFVLDHSLRKELDRLMQGKHTDQEKISAIQEFVLRSTHYVALEFGIYSYKPYPVSQIYARRFGDCKDKASLMIALLRAAGIEAEIALVRTRSLGEVALTPASVALFDHAIVYIPRYSLWLDGTAEYAGSELPAEDQGGLALTVSLDGTAQLRRVPLSNAADNYTKRTIHAQLTREGVLHFRGATITRGEGAPELRRELAVPEHQLDLFRQHLAEVFPTVQVDSVAVHGAHDFGGDVSVEFEGAVNLLQPKSAVALGSSWIRRAYVATLAPTTTRTQDLLLGSPWTTEEEIHVLLPAGASVQQLPPDQQIKTSFGSARLNYTKSAHEIVIRSRLEIAKIRINVEEYPDFHAFCSTVERSFRNQIMVALAR